VIARALRRHLGAACVVGVAAACDAFSPPEPFPMFTEDLGTGGTEIFCPAADFPVASSTRALEGPLFAWVTSAQRTDIEHGSPVLAVITTTVPTSTDQLVASMHDALPALPGALPLVGQPRIGRNFWTFAFSAPRASAEHNQLLAIWLRPDAWVASYGASYSVLDAESHSVAPEAVSASPGRVAGVDTSAFPDCQRQNFPERGFVVFREEAIERIRFGTEAIQHLDADLALLRQLLNQVRSSGASTENAFDYVECGDLYSEFLCGDNTFFPAIAWRAPEYLPTLSALSTLIDTLDAAPKGPDSALDRTSPAERDAWLESWPGSWRPGTGGAPGSGGMGGLGGANSVGGMGGSEG
jgi:hypothetical protein